MGHRNGLTQQPGTSVEPNRLDDPYVEHVFHIHDSPAPERPTEAFPS